MLIGIAGFGGVALVLGAVPDGLDRRPHAAQAHRRRRPARPGRWPSCSHGVVANPFQLFWAFVLGSGSPRRI
jgi:hypothetical protein